MPRIGKHTNTTKKASKYQPKLVGTKRKHPQFARMKKNNKEEESIEK